MAENVQNSIVSLMFHAINIRLIYVENRVLINIFYMHYQYIKVYYE